MSLIHLNFQLLLTLNKEANERDSNKTERPFSWYCEHAGSSRTSIHQAHIRLVPRGSRGPICKVTDGRKKAKTFQRKGHKTINQDKRTSLNHNKLKEAGCHYRSRQRGE